MPAPSHAAGRTSAAFVPDDAPTVPGEAITPRAIVDPASSLHAGMRLGRYLVMGEVGRGGMGVVLRAYDPELDREVALKVLRSDLVDAAARQRSMQEARAMARINHPNVVPVYDAEVGRAGGVVIVMEFVHGTTLAAWLHERSRTPSEILAACVQAGRGLAAVHAAGLLHRDFKLENVLVGSDPRGTHAPRVRVSDFGLVRMVRGSVDGPLPGARTHDDDGPELTQAGTIMGTPIYMPPEQMEGGELDARTDQYAFCVAVWRALTGRWPFFAESWELVGKKREGPPPWPDEIAAPRRVIAALRRGLRPDPADRWPSLSALLAILGSEAAGGTGEVRRRRASTLAAIVAAGLGAFAWHQAAHARRIAACASEGDAIVETWNDTRADALAEAFAQSDVAAEAWRRARPRIDTWAQEWASTRTTICAQAEIDPATVDAARACLDEQHDELASLLDRLAAADGVVIPKVGTATASLPLVRACSHEATLTMRGDATDDPHQRARVRALRAELAQASTARATGQPAVALAHAESALAGAFAASSPALQAEAKIAIGSARQALGTYDDALAPLEEAFFEATAAGRDAVALQAATQLVSLVGHRLALFDDGLQWSRTAQAIADRLGLHDELAQAALHHNTGVVLHARGEWSVAKERFTSALAIREAILGPSHPAVATALNSLGGAHGSLGEYAEARDAFERSLEIREQAFGPMDIEVAETLGNLGSVHRLLGDPERALAAMQRSLAIKERVHGPAHPDVASAVNSIGTVHLQVGDDQTALAYFEHALAIWTDVHGPLHPDLGVALSNIATAHGGLGDHASALAVQERALAIVERAHGPGHPEVAIAVNNLADTHAALGERDVALALHGRALAIWIAAVGPEHPHVATSLSNIARLHRDAGDYAHARVHYERALALRERLQGPATSLASTRFALARVLWDGAIDRPRARALAIAARDGYRSAGANEPLASVEAWLDENG